MTTFTVTEPVRLDILAKALMGTERDGCLEALLDANPGLADNPFAAEGMIIVVPPRPEKPAVAVVNPWD